ncbi:MAG TPA: hypothetical protein VMT74_07815 [Gaiellaceae bacterium]|nr:hypothetical protein [Gaiellaceae bacterium]
MSTQIVQRVLPVFLALAVAPAAVGASPPGLSAAQRACKAQGLTIGTAAYTQCVQNQLSGGGSTSSPNSSSTLTSGTAVHRAQQICLGKGLVPGSVTFMHCLTTAETRAAKTTCTAKGLAPGGSAFARCVKQHLETGTK